MEWFSFILITVILLLLFIWIPKPKNFPPGPLRLPVLGSLHALVLTKAITRHDALWMLSRKYGPVMGLHLGNIPAVAVHGYQAIKHVLNSEEFAFRTQRIPVTMKTFDRRMGVFFTDGPIWREQRRFTLRNLRDFGFGRRSMENIIHEECHALLRNVDTSDPEFDLLPLLPFSTINVLWTIMTGRRHDFEDKDFMNLTRAVMDFFRYGNPISPVNESTLLQKIPIINASYEKQLKAVNQIVRYIQATIDEHMRSYDERHMRDFMDVYIREMKQTPESTFTRDQLCAICIDLFNAGTETTSSTLAYALRYMIQHPSIQDKLRQELYRVVGTERLPGIDDIPGLHYTQAVVAEILRHSGLAPFTPPHASANDTDLLGYRIPKNTFILVNLWSIHMDPDIWGDPENFRPERFIGEDGTFHKNEHLIPFGQVCTDSLDF